MRAGRLYSCLAIAIALGAAASGGCGDAVSGTATVDWSINLQRQAYQCAALSASSIRIRVVDDTGVDMGTFEQPCALFARSIHLGRGGYSATAVLVDAAGRPRTLTAVIRPFRIAGNEDVHLTVDFPTSVSF